MAPQATLLVPTPTVSPALSTSAAAKTRKPFVPELLLIFFGVCLAYTLSYILYRIIMSRRRASHQDVPDTPDRGVSRFMNGARLTLSFGHHHKPTAPTSSGSSDMLDKEKPVTNPAHPTPLDVPASSPAESSLTPLLSLTPTFALQPNQGIGELRGRQQDPPDTQAPLSAAPPSLPLPTHRPLSRLVAAKVKFLSHDRAEAIAQDPKLAPVQGPLRPLSMVRSTSRKKRTTLFGLGLMPIRVQGGDSHGRGDAISL